MLGRSFTLRVLSLFRFLYLEIGSTRLLSQYILRVFTSQPLLFIQYPFPPSFNICTYEITAETFTGY
jgi:hypothetical protein